MYAHPYYFAQINDQSNKSFLTNLINFVKILRCKKFLSNS
jgi:hypothetical protein